MLNVIMVNKLPLEETPEDTPRDTPTTEEDTVKTTIDVSTKFILNIVSTHVITSKLTVDTV